MLQYLSLLSNAVWSSEIKLTGRYKTRPSGSQENKNTRTHGATFTPQSFKSNFCKCFCDADLPRFDYSLDHFEPSGCIRFNFLATTKLQTPNTWTCFRPRTQSDWVISHASSMRRKRLFLKSLSPWLLTVCVRVCLCVAILQKLLMETRRWPLVWSGPSSCVSPSKTSPWKVCMCAYVNSLARSKTFKKSCVCRDESS